MKKDTIIIPNISCGHCVMNIKREIEEMEGVSSVEGDAKKKEITIQWDSPASLDKIKATLNEINYPASE